MHTNRLIEEKSPYLQQHAHNPVDWRAWGPEAFEAARREDKPIFLSIGYSTCHWCHVMERESFESEEIAEVLNRSFIPVKVDREERPDVDRIYMMFVQATTGGGGWPMSVWLTPDLKPFYGGTYFPPDNRYGRPGFRTVLDHIADAWKTDRARIVESGEDVLRQMRKQSEMEPERMRTADASALETCFLMCRRTFDSRLGGFGNAPKFPRPAVYNFLLRYYYKTHNQEAVDMVLKTLHEMARGGMNDQLGGGFHRYSVDARWFVPHFEKMLYDQAQLAISYVEAFQITQDAFYSGIARDVLDYVQRDMTSPEGGFYSAEDADSVIDPANPHEKGEGAFYIWTQQEIDSVLGQPAAEWFSYCYGVEPNGNVAEDPHHEFTGRNILFEAHTAEQAISHFGITADELLVSLNESRQKLLAARAHRVRPHLDDKILTAWNGLMISAFAKGAQALGEPRYAAAAERATRFLLGKMLLPDGTLLRRYREGDAAVPGFLDDYAFFIEALLDVYETTFDFDLLRTAIRLTEKMMELFEDRENGAFFSTTQHDENLLLRMKDDYDGAEPSGNSIAALALVRLAQITGREDFRNSAEMILKVFYGRLMTAPIAVPQMLVALAAARGKAKQVILVGDKQEEGTLEFLKALHARFVPERILLLVDTPETRSALAAFIPVVAGMDRIEDKPTAYVCEDYSCKLPVTGVESFSELLQ